MAALTPLFAKAATAASLLELTAADFHKLVADGSLPGPVEISGHQRWDIQYLQKFLSGHAADGLENVKW